MNICLTSKWERPLSKAENLEITQELVKIFSLFNGRIYYSQGFKYYFPGLALNHNPPDLSFPSS
jgi:hypothetical protein